MSALQEKAVQMVRGLSDDNTVFLIEVIQRLMLQEPHVEGASCESAEECQENSVRMQAFDRLDAARMEIGQYLPGDFDPDKELEEARVERYGSVG